MRRPGRRLGAAFAVSGVAALAALAFPRVGRVRRSWDARVAVTGESMAPTLQPGDWLLVDPITPSGAARSPHLGDLVVVPDPRQP